MDIAALVLGIISLIGFLVGLVPCFGWFNWINIPISVATIIVSAIGLSNPAFKRGMVIFGIIAGCIAVIFGGIRLVIGFGVY